MIQPISLHKQNKKDNVIIISLAIIVTILLSVTAVIYPVYTLGGSLIFLFLVILFIKNKIYVFVLWATPYIFLFSQFLISPIEILRWVSLFFLVLLSVFIVPLNKIRINPIVIGLALLAFYSMLTSIISYYPLISFMKSISLLLLSVFLLLLKPTIQSLFPQIDAKIYVIRMFLNMSILIVLSNACYFIISPEASVLAGRFRGWFVNPNGVGAVYGIFFIPILAYEISKTKLRLSKYGLLLIFILASAELLATQSRAGIASGIISLLILILGQRKWDYRATIMSGLGIISLLIFLYDPENNIFLRFIYRNETILQGSGRFAIWSEIWNSLSTKPIWGSGLGVSETGAELSGIAFASIGYVIEKGNSLLAALDELGILGTGLLIIVLIVPILYVCGRGILRTDNHSNLILIAIVMAGLANSIFEAWLLSVGSILAFSFWIFASLLFGGEISNRGK